jgi:alpha-tubulin suppressor-like RCC1 family protein
MGLRVAPPLPESAVNRRSQTDDVIAVATGGESPVAVGAGHTCAGAFYEHLWCWGENGDGQLGNGTTTDSAEPVRVSAPTKGFTVQVDAGRAHTCTLTFGEGGSAVFCWGDNDEGQLGDGTFTTRLKPVPVARNAMKVVTGQEHTCILTMDATVSCWGRNDAGQLGTGTTGAGEPEPQPVPGLSDIIDVAAHDANTCAVEESGKAWCWGSDADGQLGDGGGNSATPQPSPVAVVMTGVTGGFRQIDLGQRHTCGVSGRGTAHCWGSNAAGQLGSGSTAADKPVVVSAKGRRFHNVDAGTDGTCATDDAGAVHCWGANGSGQLGTGDRTDRATPAGVDRSQVRPSPFAELIIGTAVPLLVDVNIGATHTCAVDLMTTVYCWGANAVGQLGNGTTDDTDTPTITSLTPDPVTGVKADARDRALRVSWTAPADTGVAPVEESAAIAVGTGGPDADPSGALGDFKVCVTAAAPTCTVDGLGSDRRYAIVVATATSAGASFSSIVEATTAAAGGSGGGLPITGPDLGLLLAAAAVLVGTGVTITVLARRRTRLVL